MIGVIIAKNRLRQGIRLYFPILKFRTKLCGVFYAGEKKKVSKSIKSRNH